MANSHTAQDYRATRMERETGIEPATNGLGSRDSTTELLPPVVRSPHCSIWLTDSGRAPECSFGVRRVSVKELVVLKTAPVSIECPRMIAV